MITLASGISIELSPTCARTQRCVCSFSAPKLVNSDVCPHTPKPSGEMEVPLTEIQY